MAAIKEGRAHKVEKYKEQEEGEEAEATYSGGWSPEEDEDPIGIGPRRGSGSRTRSMME